MLKNWATNITNNAIVHFNKQAISFSCQNKAYFIVTKTLPFDCSLPSISYQIIDVSGKILLKGILKKGNNQVDITQLLSGSYTFVFYNKEDRLLPKIFSKTITPTN